MNKTAPPRELGFKQSQTQRAEPLCACGRPVPSHSIPIPSHLTSPHLASIQRLVASNKVPVTANRRLRRMREKRRLRDSSSECPEKKTTTTSTKYPRSVGFHLNYPFAALASGSGAVATIALEYVMHMYLFMFSIFPCYTTTLNVCVYMSTMPAYCFDMYSTGRVEEP